MQSPTFQLDLKPPPLEVNNTRSSFTMSLTPNVKRLQAPIPPSPHRTTSQLSVISVSAHHDANEIPRKLLSRSTRQRPEVATVTSELPSDPSAPHLESHTFTTSTLRASSSGRQSSVTSTRSSIKGKERDVDDFTVDDEVAGEITVPNRDPALGLRELIRRSSEIGSLGSVSQTPSTGKSPLDKADLRPSHLGETS
jgi:hypothetical protein